MRNITIILAGSGWGAANFTTADGALVVSQYQLLKPLLEHPHIHAEVYYAQWHLNAFKKSLDYSVDERRLHVLQTAKWVSTIVETAAQKNHFILVIGGDHSLAMGTWSGIKNAGKNFGLIWIDAHMDAHTYETTLSNNPHGMPVTTLLGLGYEKFVNLTHTPPVLKPQSLMQMGIRSYEDEEQQCLESLGVNIAYHHKRHSYNSFEHFVKSRQHLLQNHPSFGVSLDIDGIDPSYCPGTGIFAENGLELADIEQSLQGLVFDPNCIGLEIAEYNPHLDQNLLTLKAIEKILKTIVTFN